VADIRARAIDATFDAAAAGWASGRDCFRWLFLSCSGLDNVNPTPTRNQGGIDRRSPPGSDERDLQRAHRAGLPAWQAVQPSTMTLDILSPQPWLPVGWIQQPVLPCPVPGRDHTPCGLAPTASSSQRSSSPPSTLFGAAHPAYALLCPSPNARSARCSFPCRSSDHGNMTASSSADSVLRRARGRRVNSLRELQHEPGQRTDIKT